eukprot:151325-Chlamydomonas_euryale.AAC.10
MNEANEARAVQREDDSRMASLAPCFPSSHDVFAVVMKNWEPLVLGPALAMDRYPGRSCFSVKFSSGNLVP